MPRITAVKVEPFNEVQMIEAGESITIDPDPFIDALSDAFEAGVDEHFEAECERILRAAVAP